MLRPAELLAAQEKAGKGEISPAELKAAEDRAVDGAIKIQEDSGVDVVTDGEMRRMVFTGPLTETVDGIEFDPTIEQPAMQWHGDEKIGDLEMQIPIAITGKLRRKRSLATEEYVYAQARTNRPIKATLPSPLMLSVFWTPGISDREYKDAFECFADGAAIVREEAEELAGLGCEDIQIDAPELATHVLTKEQREFGQVVGSTPIGCSKRAWT